jgi:hypothetical protein
MPLGPLVALALAGQETNLADSVVLLTNGDAVCAGAFIDASGGIATAYHCIAKGGDIRIETRDGKIARGHTRSARASADLAIVDAPTLAGSPYLELQPDPPSPGAVVTVIGHPYGARQPVGWMGGLLRWSVATGIVSAVGPVALQVSAPINPGNSGGPVIDDAGRLIGVVSRKLNGDGLGFAARADQVADLVAHPKRPSWLGGTVDLMLGTSLWDGDHGTFSFGARLELSFRDRVVLGVTPNFPLHPNWDAVRYGQVDWVGPELRVAVRQRLFRGPATTRIDAFVGGASWARMVGTPTLRTSYADDIVPTVGAGVTVGSIGAELAWSPAAEQGWVPRYTILFRWPGTVSMF